MHWNHKLPSFVTLISVLTALAVEAMPSIGQDVCICKSSCSPEREGAGEVSVITVPFLFRALCLGARTWFRCRSSSTTSKSLGSPKNSLLPVSFIGLDLASLKLHVWVLSGTVTEMGNLFQDKIEILL